MMRTRMVEEREGEDVGDVDWEHPDAKDMPPIWRAAAQDPSRFMFDNGGLRLKRIYRICMWDGWPYWKPKPAIQFEGTLGPEWNHFTSYGVGPKSIVRVA